MNLARANTAARYLAENIIGELREHGVELVSSRPGIDPKQHLGAILYRQIYEPQVKRSGCPLWLFLIGAAVAIAVVWLS